jgi:hypothetical protein
MRFDNLTRLAQLLFKVDSIIAGITMNRLLTRLALTIAATLIVVFGLIMLGVGGFYALEQIWGPVWAAVAVAAGSFVLAVLLLLFATYRKPGRELELAIEVHNATFDNLVSEARATGQDFSSVGNLLRHPFDSTLLGLIGPLASILIRTLKKTPRESKST